MFSTNFCGKKMFKLYPVDFVCQMNSKLGAIGKKKQLIQKKV
jgi:hypothetical protein